MEDESVETDKGYTIDTSLKAKLRVLERFGSESEQELVAEIRRLRKKVKKLKEYRYMYKDLCR